MRPLTFVFIASAGAFCAPAFADVDLSGNWVQKMHEDRRERAEGPDIGDYTGLPINDAARMRAETWDAARWSVPEHQCEPHPADYAPHGPASLRIWSEVDPITQEVIAWHIVYLWMNSHRVIWMDGRPHPPPEAPHTWMGFSTGKWVGDTLVVTTTHLKEGWLRRNGVPRSDLGKLTEYWMRFGSYLTLMGVIEDPVYLTAPLVRTWNWVLDPGYQIAPYNCTYRVETELPRGFVAHHLPGKNPLLAEFTAKHELPPEIARGGEHTMYPGFKVPKSAVNPTQTTSAAKRAPTHKKRESAAPAEPEARVLHVQGNVYMLSINGTNTAIQVGEEGVLVVDTQRAEMSEKALAEIRKLSSKPIRYVINTSADPERTGGNQPISSAGVFNTTFSGRAAYSKTPEAAPIYAHENVLMAMSQKPRDAKGTPPEALPTETYFTGALEIFLNDEPIRVLHQPAAHSDGDSIVFFQRSNVIATGAVFSTISYPVIDLERGGSINGVIEALNTIIDITIPKRHQEGGTMVIPGNGRICDEYEVVIYRDMVTIIRDRVQDLINQGKSLEEVLDANITMDYDGRYGAEQGEWTTRQFVEAVYKSLKHSERAASEAAESSS